MKVYVPCRHTLGDVLSAYFCTVNYGKPNTKAQLLGRLRNACLQGACESAFVVSEFSFWTEVDFSVGLRSEASFGELLSDNGWERDELVGHHNLLRTPHQVAHFDPMPTVELPVRAPKCQLPPDYILFTDGAGYEDRRLADPKIVHWLRSYLPVVRIGSSGRHWRLPMGPCGATLADVDLCDRTDLTEVFWLAKHASLIVSPCTYLRTMSAVFGTPVLELVQNGTVQESTVLRTIKEYSGFEYGMQPGFKNIWSFWNDHPSAENIREVERFLNGGSG